MDGQAGEQMCPVCTLYLRPGMTLHEHLFTHPKDQVIEALVRIAAVNSASAVTTVNTNSHQQFTAITYRQFQTLTTSVPETNIPMMLNPCLVNSSSPFSSGVIRSSVPLLSYPYYPPEQQNSSNLSEQRVENNTQCSYTYTSQTTQTTQTNSPFVTNNNSPFTEVADCEEVQTIDDNCENYELEVDPFVNEQSENHNSPTNLPDTQVARDELFVNKKINGVHTTLNSPVDSNIVNRNENAFVNGGLANIHDTNVDPLDINNSDENDNKQEHLHHKQNLSHQEKDNLINTAHSLGTVISNTHRLMANDPTLDYDQDLRTDDIDYSEQNYDNLSPNRNVVSPVSDASNWSSGSGIRVRRDLSSLDESDNLHILYVRQNSNASEYVTSDPFDEENGHQPSGGQLTNLDNVNFSSIGLYSTNQHLTGRLEDNEHKEDSSVQSVPLNIHSDELMPPRGELSGQESLGATENSVWELQVSVSFRIFAMLVCSSSVCS